MTARDPYPRTMWHMLRTLLHVLRVWRKNPELRLGQLLCNLSRPVSGPDCWCVLDREIMTEAQRVRKEGWEVRQ